MTTLYSINTSGTSTISGGEYLRIVGDAEYSNGSIESRISKKTGISPILYFKYIKKKLKFLQKMKLESRIKKIQKAFDVAVANGQDVLAEKFLKEFCAQVKEAELYSNGIKVYIDRSDLHKHKNNLEKGHISNTKYEDYTRHIPKDVVAKKKEVQKLFDSFEIYHYWNEEAQKDTKAMTPTEKAKMRDPVLFGLTKEAPNKLYYIAEWEDEHCDLSFADLVDVLELEEEDVTMKIGFDHLTE